MSKSRARSGVIRGAALLLAASVLASCERLTGTTCVGTATPAIEIDAVDSLTQQTLTSGTVFVATDAGYRDTVIATSSIEPARLAYDRAGTYRVEAHRDGYRLWVRDAVQVPRGECRVETVRLTARLIAS